MIQLKTAKTGQLELTDRKNTVHLTASSIELAEQNFSQAGEYEAGGIEVIYGENAALIVWEQIQVVYVFNTNPPSAFEKNQFASCDIVIFSPQLTELTKNNTTAILDEYDPRLVVFPVTATFENGFKDSLKLQETNLLKFSSATLPTEERESYLLV